MNSSINIDNIKTLYLKATWEIQHQYWWILEVL
jgi:hypothetical protein